MGAGLCANHLRYPEPHHLLVCLWDWPPAGPTPPLLYPLRPMSDTPDWSQVATKQDLIEATQELKRDLKQELKYLKWTMYGGLLWMAALSDRAAALFEYIQQGL